MRRICFLFVLLIFLMTAAGCSVNLVNGGNYAVYANADAYVAGGRTLEGVRPSSILLDWISGSVEIVCGTGDAVVISEESSSAADELAVHSLVEGDTLRIHFAGSGARLPSELQKALRVELPADCSLASLNVDVVSSGLTLSRVQTGRCAFSCVSGGVTAQECSLGVCSVDGVSGSIELERCAYTSLSVDTVSGALSYTGELCGAIEVNGVSADVRLALPADTRCLCTFSTLSGTLSDGGILLDAADGTPILIETVSGNVTFSAL